ncbi:MAG: O-antigen ligase family protein [Saprospiraceae bacterium]|nr:O-antigen ligase family protein [Saprospiraceae bacterium]
MVQSLKIKGWFIIAILATYLVRTPGVMDEYLVGRFLWLTLVSLFGILFILKKSRPIPFNVLDFALIGFYLISLFSLLWAGVPSAGLTTVQTVLILIALFYCFRLLLPETSECFLGRIFALLTVILLGFTLFQIVKLGLTDGIGGQAIYEVTGLSAHKNILAAHLLLLFGMNLWFLSSGKSRNWMYFLLTLQVIAIFLLRSRTTLLALTLFIGIIGMYYLTRDLRKWKIMFSRFLAMSLAVLIVTTLIFTRLGGSSQEINRFNPANFMKDASMVERLFVWYKTKYLIEDQWLWGYGAGNWKIIFPSKSISGGYRLQSKDLMFTRVHNDFLEVWAEQGIFGFIFFTSVFLIGTAVLLFQLRQSKKSDIRPVILFGLLLSYMIISFFDFPKERLELQVMLAFILALVVRSCPGLFRQQRLSWRPSNSAFRVLLVSAGILLLFNLPIGYFQIKGESHTLKAMKAQISAQWPVVESESLKAYSPFYQITPMAIAIKWYEGLALYHQGNYPKARSAFEIAIQHTPYFIRLLNDFASCLVQLKDFEGARDLYLQVMFINPKFEDGMFNLAYVYSQLSDFEKAYEWVNKTQSDPDRKKEFIQEIDKLRLIDSN